MLLFMVKQTLRDADTGEKAININGLEKYKTKIEMMRYIFFLSKFYEQKHFL